MRETFDTIRTWADATFGPCKPARALERAREEWDELIEPGADVTTEAADVIICLLRLPGILETIDRKMEINRARRWHQKGDGTGYHIKEPVHPLREQTAAPVKMEPGEPHETGGFDIDRNGPPPFFS